MQGQFHLNNSMSSIEDSPYIHRVHGKNIGSWARQFCPLFQPPHPLTVGKSSKVFGIPFLNYKIEMIDYTFFIVLPWGLNDISLLFQKIRGAISPHITKHSLQHTYSKLCEVETSEYTSGLWLALQFPQHLLLAKRKAWTCWALT